MVDGGPGRWRSLHNWAADREGSIHHDETARAKGFPSGLVPGDVHVVVVTSELVDRFGRDWYERGFLRMTFVKPVFNGEDVRFNPDPPTGHADRLGWELVKRDGTLVCAGNAGLAATGDAVAPWRDDRARDSGDYDPLPHEAVGQEYEERVHQREVGSYERTLRGNDDCPWYRDGSPWGPPVMPTVAPFDLAHRIRAPEMPAVVGREMASGMNAGFEALHRGPMFYDRPYRRRAWLAEKGVSGRYAFRTVDFSFEDADTGASVFEGRWRIKWVTSRPSLASAS